MLPTARPAGPVRFSFAACKTKTSVQPVGTKPRRNRQPAIKNSRNQPWGWSNEAK